MSVNLFRIDDAEPSSAWIASTLLVQARIPPCDCTEPECDCQYEITEFSIDANYIYITNHGKKHVLHALPSGKMP